MLGHVEQPHRFGGQGHAHAGQPFGDDLGRLAAPAVGAEGTADLVLGFEALHVGQHVRHLGHDAVVVGGRTHQHGGGVPDLLHDVGVVEGVQVHDLHRKTMLHESVGQGVGHGLGGVPHGVENDDSLFLLFLDRQFLVTVHGVGHVLGRPVQQPMVGQEVADVEPHGFNGGNGLERNGAVGQDDVGVIPVELFLQQRPVHFVGEAFAGGPVLAEGIRGDEHAVPGNVGGHVVRPVQHPGLQELQRTLSDGDRSAGGHDFDGPVRTVEMRLHGPFAHGRGEDLFGLGPGHHFGQGPGVVHFHMVDDDVVDVLGFDQMRQAAQQLAAEVGLDRIDQGGLLVLDQKGIVGRSTGRGGVAMEVTTLPVHGTNPVDILTYFHRSHEIPRFSAEGGTHEAER